ncbi:MAG: hypothetical protein MdMp024_1746 [Bacteroidales bacterium]
MYLCGKESVFMKPNLLCIYVFLILPVQAYAVNLLRTGDARSVGMGGNEAVTTALFNPSLIALSEKRSAGINFFSRYALKELATAGGNIYLPNDVLPTGFHFSSFGYDAYRECLFRFLSGKRLNRRWTLGVSVQYAFLQTELFEEQPAQLAADIGLTYTPFDNLLISLLVINFPSATFGHENLDKPDFSAYLVQAGFQWQAIERVFISSALERTEAGATGLSLGMEYRPYDAFAIRAGVRGTPLLPAMGFGFSFSSITVDAAVVYHPLLGISTGAGLSFSF